MQLTWFKKWGWLYWPISVAGWVLVFIVIGLIAWVGMVADRNAHSTSDTLINTFPWAWIFVVTLGWIASKTSTK